MSKNITIIESVEIRQNGNTTGLVGHIDVTLPNSLERFELWFNRSLGELRLFNTDTPRDSGDTISEPDLTISVEIWENARIRVAADVIAYVLNQYI